MTFDFDKLPDSDSEVIEHHSRSFSLAAKLLPKRIRADVKKLYAWCRWCDDSVDEAPNTKEAKDRLEVLRFDVERIYNGELPVHAASQWLAQVTTKYDIPKRLPLDLLKGMEADLSSPIIDSIDELLEYCYQAAGTVGMMMSHIMGVTGQHALRKAKALGIAMQLSNIARDVNEDWQSGRRYIPKKWLPLVPKKDMTPTNAQVKPAVKKILSLADKFYQEGFYGLEYLPDNARPAIRLAGNVYQEIGHEIRRQDFKVMQDRVFVSLRQKLFLAIKCIADECCFRVVRLLGPIQQSLLVGQYENHSSLGGKIMNDETRYLGYLGISLTFVMGTTLFFLMGLNPKAPTYSTLPWVYSAICALSAGVTGLIARRINKRLRLQTAQKMRTQ